MAQTETLDDDIVVVGSGPAGVSAAWAMVEAGMRVRMLDGGAETVVPQPPTGTIGAFRGAPDRWAHQFGTDLLGVWQDRALAPKAATPRARAITASFRGFAELETDGFLAFTALHAGGLSAIWGALATRFGEHDLQGYPIGLADLSPSYDAVRARIGMRSDPRPPLAPHLRRMLERFSGMPPGRDGLRLQPAENAVLTDALPERGECVRCGLCLWGCHRGSIYNSASELAALRRRPNFAFEPLALVRRLHPAPDGQRLEVARGEGVQMLLARRVALATGTLATTALVVDRLGQLGTPVRLHNNPVAAMAFVVPAMFGQNLPEESFSLAQLFYEVPLPDGGAAAGALYGADSLPLDAFARRLPFTRPTALRLARLLAPALVLATCYVPSRYSRNTVTIERRGERLAIVIRGETTATARAALLAAKRRLALGLWRLGAVPLPSGFAIAVPGSDAHCAGTVPMLSTAERRAGPSCSVDGEVHGAPGLFVVDGAALPALPARHCTLTVMANADRVGRALGARLKKRPPAA